MEEIPVSLGLPSRRTATTSIVPPCLNVSTVIGRLCVFFFNAFTAPVIDVQEWRILMSWLVSSVLFRGRAHWSAL